MFMGNLDFRTGQNPYQLVDPLTGQVVFSGSDPTLALRSADNFETLKLIDTLPSSATYLQTLVNTPIPGASPPLNDIGRVHLTADGESAMVLLTIGFVSVSSGIHRYDVASNTWIDHNPALAGLQAIGPNSSPRGPMVGGGNDLALARDGSFGTITNANQIYRFDFDPTNTSSWSRTIITGSWTPFGGYGSTISSDGKRIVLRAPDVPMTDSELILLDSSTGAVLATNLLIGAPWISRIAKR